MRFENDVELYRTIGVNIKNYRKKSNISQAKLAEDVGISLSYISKIEASGCDKSVSVSVLNQIANALGIEITKLFEGDF
jgi:transcriptional regulator with XRE-family HTH domain